MNERLSDKINAYFYRNKEQFYANMHQEQKKGIPKEMTVKPIDQTVELKGKFARDFLRDVFKKPSASSIERNKNASQLLKKLRG
ncbi:hypothetical protein D3C87_919710 [compost metagenome]